MNIIKVGRVEYEIPYVTLKTGGKGIFESCVRKFTLDSGRAPMFAGDQTEHGWSSDFYGKSIPVADIDPHHFVDICRATGLPLAVHPGYIDRYGSELEELDIPIVVKMNGKDDVQPNDNESSWLCDTSFIEDMLASRLNVVAGGMTLYPGSESAPCMMECISNIIRELHGLGILAILWNYPRGTGIEKLRSQQSQVDKVMEVNGVSVDVGLAVNAGRLANDLGADFVKINLPSQITDEEIKMVVRASGNTKVFFAGGGKTKTVRDFFNTLRRLLDLGASGAATGRNLHQDEYPVAFGEAYKTMVCANADVDTVMRIYENMAL